MAELRGAPFVDLIDRMRLEFAQQGSLFDLPARRWWLPSDEPDAPDLSVRFHGRPAGTPVGPASGPQTQMAQNLVLCWLAGSRIMELKTVQIDDRLTIGRPCIDATNVGYNIEFSQELRVAESLDQYVQGAMLIHMLRQAPDMFGRPFGDVDFAGSAGETVFDMSIGYDLAGIRSDKVRHFIEGIINASGSVSRLREQIPPRWVALRDLDYPTDLSRSITLSTFHGCPAEEIERICEFLLTEMDVDTIVKMNPPMLGKDRLEHLLHDVMGYDEIRVNPAAYTSGLQFDESIAVSRRLASLADSRGRRFGAKFSNTLEVLNHRDFFSADEKVMYLSGPPLYVITMTLADEFRQAIGSEMPISFSAGVDRKNFAATVACGFLPVTTCTDLLKTGGYGRLPAYLQELEKAMRGVGASSVEEFILRRGAERGATPPPQPSPSEGEGERERCASKGEGEREGCASKGEGEREGCASTGEGEGSVARAGWQNTSAVAQHARADERYYRRRNNMVPKRINSRLVLFDCITCDKCIPVCPNDANFLYETPAVDLVYRDVEITPDGKIAPCGCEKRFTLKREEQIANFADFCNHCGNCDTFCPEWDGPYLMKPNFFGSRESFEADARHDGFLLEDQGGRCTLFGRIDGTPCRLDERGACGVYRYDDGTVTVIVEQGTVTRLAHGTDLLPSRHLVDVGRFHTLVALLRGITNPSRVHQVNTRLLAQ